MILRQMKSFLQYLIHCTHNFIITTEIFIVMRLFYHKSEDILRNEASNYQVWSLGKTIKYGAPGIHEVKCIYSDNSNGYRLDVNCYNLLSAP